ncbi:hypothetical protein IJG78_01555 [Candidatus Saccharibacteria bacterium]|nr:hypothetical protein [Candidatus Saccharibacteria bacterium]
MFCVEEDEFLGVFEAGVEALDGEVLGEDVLDTGVLAPAREKPSMLFEDGLLGVELAAVALIIW